MSDTDNRSGKCYSIEEVVSKVSWTVSNLQEDWTSSLRDSATTSIGKFA